MERINICPMSESYHEDPYATGKDLPAEGQIAASVGRLLSGGDKYLQWARLAREEARRNFPETYARIVQSDLDRLGITPEEEITD